MGMEHTRLVIERTSGALTRPQYYLANSLGVPEMDNTIPDGPGEWISKAEIDRLRAELDSWKEQFRVLAILEQQKTAELARSLEENKRVRKDYEIVTVDNAAKDARIAHWENLGAGTSDAYTPDLGPEEKIVWILGDMMNAVENQFGVENAKRLGHIHCCADRLLREVIDPKDARIAELEAERAKLSSFHDMLTKLSHALARAEKAEARIAELEAGIGIDWQAAFHREKARAEKAEARIAELEDKLSTAVWSRDHERADNGALRKRVAELEADLLHGHESGPIRNMRARAERAERALHIEAYNAMLTRAEQAEARLGGYLEVISRAERAEVELAEAKEQVHYANGVADLAMKHRDSAEARVAEAMDRLCYTADECDLVTACEHWVANFHEANARAERAEAVLHLYAEAQRWATGTEEHRLALQKADTYRAALAPSPAGALK